ncbi:MAG: energy transducer TonB [Dysgonamonadaceae bacterium]|jgi:protein TonB|nr:energy transducer TonB [Dysgonamonadaceae bacterium]
MAKGIDLTSKEWLDLIFEGKNKEYGAYELRESSSKRHIEALVIVTVAGLLLVYLPQFIRSVTPYHVSENFVETEEIKVIDIEVPEKIETIVSLEAPVPLPPLAPAVKFVDFVVVPDSKITIDDLLPTQIALTETDAAIATVSVEGVPGGTAHVDETHGEIFGTGSGTGTEKPYDFVEQPPQFPGGEKELMKWLNTNIKYPLIALEQGIEGRVILRFVVGADGSVSSVEIQRSLDPSCDREAVRVIKNMPKWNPGKQNGQTVSVYYTLPVLFKITK